MHPTVTMASTWDKSSFISFCHTPSSVLIPTSNQHTLQYPPICHLSSFRLPLSSPADDKCLPSPIVNPVWALMRDRDQIFGGHNFTITSSSSSSPNQTNSRTDKPTPNVTPHGIMDILKSAQPPPPEDKLCGQHDPNDLQMQSNNVQFQNRSMEFEKSIIDICKPAFGIDSSALLWAKAGLPPNISQELWSRQFCKWFLSRLLFRGES